MTKKYVYHSDSVSWPPSPVHVTWLRKSCRPNSVRDDGMRVSDCMYPGYRSSAAWAGGLLPLQVVNLFHRPSCPPPHRVCTSPQHLPFLFASPCLWADWCIYMDVQSRHIVYLSSVQNTFSARGEGSYLAKMWVQFTYYAWNIPSLMENGVTVICNSG